jgi:hypothetical protein
MHRSWLRARVAFTMPPVTDRSLRRAWRLGLLFLGASIAALIFNDYGMTWDEHVHHTHGELLLAYFTSGFQDTRCLDYINLMFYGPLVDLSSAALSKLLGTPRVETQHALIACFGLAAIAGVLEMGAQSRRRWAIVVAPLAIVLMPRFFGHSFTNPKDLPFACLYAWSLLWIARAAADGLKSPRPLAICAVVMSTAVAIRPGALPLLVAIFVGAIGYRTLAESVADQALDLRNSLRLAGRTLAVFVAVWLGMIALWPFAHQAPLANPIAAIREASAFSFDYQVLFNGSVQSSSQLAWFYIPAYIVITTPLVILSLGLLGILASTARASRFAHDPPAMMEVTALLGVALPLGAAVVLHPNVYDGLRHFLFVLPPLAFFAAIGVDLLVGRLEARIAPKVLGVGLVITLLFPLAAIVRLHPYQTSFFNSLVGGLNGAQSRFETDYWVSSYKEAVEWVNAQAEQATEEELPIRLIVAANSFNTVCATYYASDRVQIKTVWRDPGIPEIPAPYDYFLSTTRYGKDKMFPNSSIAHTVSRDAAPLTVIRKR